MLAIDTSHSMAANDVPPTRLAAAQASARRFLAQSARQIPRRRRRLQLESAARRSPDADRPYVNSALAALRVGQGTALGDAIATSVKVASTTPAGQKQRAGQPPPPAAILVLSDGAQDGGSVKLADAVSRARKAKVPVFTAVLGTPAGVVQVPHIGGFVERIQVPPDPAALRAVAAPTGGASSPRPRRTTSPPVYADLKSRLGKTRKSEEITVAFAGAGVLLPARRRRTLCHVVPEGPVIRAAAAVIALATALAVGVPASRAADECRGFRSASRSPAPGS